MIMRFGMAPRPPCSFPVATKNRSCLQIHRLNDASFTYAFALFNGSNFLDFFKLLVEQYPKRKIFLIIDST